MGKMAHIAPSSSNKSNYPSKKVKVEHEPSNLKGSFLKFVGFACPLYVEVLEIGDGSPISHKIFVKIYGFSSKGMKPKRVRIPKDLTIEEVSNFFGPIHNKNGHNYVHSEDNVLIAKVERLWMFVHQQAFVPTTRIVSLGFARGMAMELKCKRMNWALYVEWTN